MSSVAVRDVIASSSFVNHVEVSGHSVTSAWSAGGSRSWGIRHSWGMDELRASIFVVLMSFHEGVVSSLAVVVVVVVRVMMSICECTLYMFG